MKKTLKHIIKQILSEQGDPSTDAATPLETDNAPSDAKDSPFTPAEERFLGKFDAYGSQHLGILYSTSDAGIREFIARSGKELNVSPGILRSLFRRKIIKFVPYTGFGRNDDYTIELQLSLDDVKGLGKADQAKAETGSTASGAAPAGGAPPPPENAGVIRYGHVLTEMLVEQKSKTQSTLSDNEIRQCNDALVFWKSIVHGTKSYNWDEDMIIETLMDIKNRQAAIYIDAIGYILMYVESQQHPEYLKFISTLGHTAVTFTELPIALDSGPGYTLPRLLNDGDFIDNIFYDDLNTDPDYQKLKSAYASRGIGQLIPSRAVQLVAAKGSTYFYPAYTKAEVYALVKKLTKPFLSNADTKSNKEKNKIKQQEIANKSKYIKSKIENNKSLYSQKFMELRHTDSRYSIPTDISKITIFKYNTGVVLNGVDFKGTWMTSAGKPYIWFSGGLTVAKLFNDGSFIETENNRAKKRGKWSILSPTKIYIELI